MQAKKRIFLPARGIPISVNALVRYFAPNLDCVRMVRRVMPSESIYGVHSQSKPDKVQ